ncbi:Glutamate-ammonia-ligase adenylyltransferase [Corynebacterium choanae]|uniref:Glutamate-ammonia-ligase adenylyltransferase n=2 Tax=Corynebacterium choanae TaxID=1862358 RepID=A0A3G6J8A2_9CORY|nr:bifunctional [glutamine synthetase] adenylyltransferase/[glutamine synthetase]-adenylyl-L-tyrosine phosphorylase [Corynebacterium choanae]AZA14003.1 Glutamate-ammonia-ligase adenylyltransferase [Corynebacterium choanae]
MQQARSSRRSVPTPAALGLTQPQAQQDLEYLGWNNPDSVVLLWALSGVGDPDLALNTLVRFYDQLASTPTELAECDAVLRRDPTFRVVLLALLGGSRALGDHLVANPTLWRTLLEPIPDRATMFDTLLQAVAAVPIPALETSTVETADPATGETVQSAEGGAPGRPRQHGQAAGSYFAHTTGAAAVAALSRSYRSLLLRIAAHDLAGTYLASVRRPGVATVPFTTVTGALTDLADAALTASLAVGFGSVFADVEAVNCRIAVIAMGKCGAGELNYLSDVDVIFVSDPADAKATRVAGEMIRVGSRACFEIDAALRPEGKHGALVRTLDSHLTYYQKWADTWEFQALLKARPATGDMDLGQAYLAALHPLVWEASQRESFVEDTQAMRARVVAHVPAAEQDRELKLGRGGLRDVEFAIQLLQMVHGRVDHTLRVRSTVDAITALIDGGYIGRDDGNTLLAAYETMRLVEHRLQLQRVRRTHTLPEAADEQRWRWLARSSGISPNSQETYAAAAQRWWARTRRSVADVHTKLFYRPLLKSVVALDADTLRLTPAAAQRQFAVLGYQFPDRAWEHLKYLATGARRAAKIQAMLLPTLLGWLSATADPDAGLLNYRRLCDAAKDDSWFLRMLRDEGIVGRRLMTILGNSPFVTDLFLQAPDMVKLLGDGAAGPKLLAADLDHVTTSLVSTALRHGHTDRAIAAARSLRRRELARIAAADLLGMMQVEDVCHALSTVWDAVLEAALQAEIKAALPDSRPAATSEQEAIETIQHPETNPIADHHARDDANQSAALATPHSGAEDVSEEFAPDASIDLAPARIAVIGMGRLGGGELGYGSDADVMVVCKPSPGIDETTAIKWATRIIDRMRRRLAKPSGDPPLDVDLGLRPEGRSGAIVRTLESYRSYYERWGETWELQALLRAAPVAGDAELGQAFVEMIDQFRYPHGGVSKKTVQQVRRMKARVDTERLPKGADRNVHTKLGRGALTDIEWTVQLLQLQHADAYPSLRQPSTLAVLDELANHALLTTEQAAHLRQAWLTATKARNALVLVKGKRHDQLPHPGPQLAPVAGVYGWDPADYQGFYEHYLRTTRQARAVVDTVFWGEASSFEP